MGRGEALVLLTPLALGDAEARAGWDREKGRRLTSGSCFVDPEHGGGAGSHLQPGEIPHYQRGAGGECPRHPTLGGAGWAGPRLPQPEDLRVPCGGGAARPPPNLCCAKSHVFLWVAWELGSLSSLAGARSCTGCLSRCGAGWEACLGASPVSRAGSIPPFTVALAIERSHPESFPGKVLLHWP